MLQSFGRQFALPLLALAILAALAPHAAQAHSTLRCRDGWNGAVECRDRSGKVVLVCRPAFSGNGFECKPR